MTAGDLQGQWGAYVTSAVVLRGSSGDALARLEPLARKGPSALTLNELPTVRVRSHEEALAAAPSSVAGRIAAALDGVADLQVVVVPSGWPGMSHAGPVDGVVIAPTPLAGPIILRCSQTQCMVLVLRVLTPDAQTLSGTMRALAAADDVLVAGEDLDLAGTAEVAEYFRDLGRPDGLFWEAIVFGPTVRVDRATVEMVVAAHAAAVVVDAMRALDTRTCD